MRILFATIILFCSLSLQADYYVSIGNNSDINNSIVSTGGGNNYYGRTLSDILLDKTYSDDPLLKGFVYMLKRYQQGQSDRADAYLKLKKNTPYSDINLKISIFDGSNGIIFFDVISEGKRIETFTPMAIKDGEWIMGGKLLQNSNVNSIVTTLLNYGMQIKPDEFNKYKNFLATLPTSKSYPVITKITHNSAKVPAFVITHYKYEAETLKKVSDYFKNSVAAHATKDSNFYSYWDSEERENLDKIKNAKNRLLTMESPVLHQLEKCGKDGYSILGISEIGTIIILYVLTDSGDFSPFFLRKYPSGELKFVASSSFGCCSLYMVSFFTSTEFEDSFMQSSSVFSATKDMANAINSLLKQN